MTKNEFLNDDDFVVRKVLRSDIVDADCQCDGRGGGGFATR